MIAFSPDPPDRAGLPPTQKKPAGSCGLLAGRVDTLSEHPQPFPSGPVPPRIVRCPTCRHAEKPPKYKPVRIVTHNNPLLRSSTPTTSTTPRPTSNSHLSVGINNHRGPPSFECRFKHPIVKDPLSHTTNSPLPRNEEPVTPGKRL